MKLFFIMNDLIFSVKIIRRKKIDRKKIKKKRILRKKIFFINLQKISISIQLKLSKEKMLNSIIVMKYESENSIMINLRKKVQKKSAKSISVFYQKLIKKR